ncbi:MAG: hypothetical protein QG597_1878 [Actinomycetota bacterium]|nr:hypothetical protein [Actinomycetota bacterium]
MRLTGAWRLLRVVRRSARVLATRALGGRRDGSGPLAPPSWAVRSVPDGGGIVHESECLLVPDAVHRDDVYGSSVLPAEVSIRVVDHDVHGRWHRTEPVVDVEGGSYGLEAAGRLATAIDELRDIAAHELGTRPPR